MEKYFHSYLINSVTFKAMIGILSSVFKVGNCEEIFYFFASHIYTNRVGLAKYVHNFVMADFFMIRSCRVEDIELNYRFCKEKKLIRYEDKSRLTVSEPTDLTGLQRIKSLP